jgi:DNA polymerase III subunit epsilon
MDFVVIDVETANSAFSSICQVGVARFNNGKLWDTWGTLVDPKAEFDFMNVSIHGIDSDKVAGAPTWIEVYPRLLAFLGSDIVVSHTSFDRAAINAACLKDKETLADLVWLDTACVVRRAWPQFAKKGYGLRNVCNHFGIQFQHHNAVEDARAAGEILLKAMLDTSLGVDQWLIRVTKPLNLEPQRIDRDGSVEGPLFGETIVFTGKLSITRDEAGDLAAKAGCHVGEGVTKQTTILVVGDQDIRQLAGHQKSSKHRKAEALISSGQPIRVIAESDFRALLSMNESIYRKQLRRSDRAA